ncbi:DUF2490 domain-containing protein [Leeuwenhoekiella parthenopeia]|uniref:DUF2490 domain-containing protein n=1 Tax=Leeuwenhoekiella parthenopeia TaxID=2890320 RepID=A0ABS8GQP4_9FLAO|nr:DUF2490 domain-containing protein [Leeuwenhoekiella parthenopeia]MCC4212043.1 DUF2490 domain-containing protein [Leeuwenhoekiella parthenopeia]
MPSQKIILPFLLALTLAFVNPVRSQDSPDMDSEAETRESKYKDVKRKFWFNTYGNIRISKRLFWIAQTHLRFEETAGTPYVGQIGQIYNRHAIGYIYDKKTNFALGGVLRLNFNTDPDSEGPDLLPEYRIWHQYQFAMPVYNAMAYHRIRIEHRWSKSFGEEDEYIFRNRYRYMFRLKVPLNKPSLQPGALYVAPESEVILQSGKQVIDSPLEDVRLNTTLGYIINPRLTVAAGFMYSFGQTLDDGSVYNQNYTFRIHMYFSPDLRKVKNKLPSVHFRD